MTESHNHTLFNQPVTLTLSSSFAISLVVHVNNMTQSNLEMEKPKTVEELINKHRPMRQPSGTKRWGDSFAKWQSQIY